MCTKIKTYAIDEIGLCGQNKDNILWLHILFEGLRDPFKKTKKNNHFDLYSCKFYIWTPIF